MFQPETLSATQNFERVAASCAAEHATKVKLTLLALGSLYLEHMFTCDTVFEHTYLCIITSYCLSTADVANLNKTSKAFSHFHKMILHSEPNIVFKLFQNDPDHASQTSVPIERML